MTTTPINKVVVGDKTLMDLTGDTVAEKNVTKGITFHDKTGAKLTGTSTLDSDTSDATAEIGDITSGKIAYIRGERVVGNLPINGKYTKSITTLSETVNIPYGSHDGSGSVNIAPSEQSKLTAENIRQGVTVLGVTGTMTGTESVKAESKTVQPKFEQQEVIPSMGFNYLTSVTVEAIPYSESPNSAGGTTVTIGNPV